MNKIVLDASALLAFLRNEPGAQQVAAALENTAHISIVNWAEVLSKIAELGINCRETIKILEEQGILGQALVIEPVTEEDCINIANLKQSTKKLGLSLGDRTCITLGIRMKARIFTTDKNWQHLNLSNLKIEVIR